MKTYYIYSDDNPRGLSHSVESGKALIGAGTTDKIDLTNTGHVYLKDVVNPVVYEHRYNEENHELKYSWAPAEGTYELWVKGASIYFKEK